MEQEDKSGHRQRLRQRFAEQGLDGFQDYEALELLLQFVARQKDMKPAAKALIAKFGSFKNALDAPTVELESVPGVGPAGAVLLQVVKQAAARYLRQTSRERFTSENPQALVEYCIARMGAEPNETFRVFCLDSSYVIVGEEEIAQGTVNQAAVFPRRVMEIALAARATTLVFAHNHPDGNIAPSDADKTLTRSLVLAAKTLGISVYDHLVVSRDAAFSFREHGLL
jgi:DNA repair protein RadC